jgi:hypothetical protein
MAKSKRKRVPRTVLKLPDLEQSKSAVLNSLTSSSSKRSNDHAIREFIDWYCSEPRLAFNRTGGGPAHGKFVTFGVTRGCIAVASPVSSITWLIAP